MRHFTAVCSLFLMISITLLAGCGGDSGFSPVFIPATTTSLSPDNVNLIFVVTPDLANNASGDVNPDTANLSNQGLNRSLQMASYLKQQVLGGQNVTRIFTLQPMSHLQTANNYPDMAAIGYIQQFAMLNQVSLTALGGYNSPLYTANSYPLNTAYYSTAPLPSGVAVPYIPCTSCQGLDFNNAGNGNDYLLAETLKFNIPGFYLFVAPWDTISKLMTTVNALGKYSLTLPATYAGPNYVYAISVKPTAPSSASLTTFNSKLIPAATYPVLPAPIASAACPGQNTTPAYFNITATAGTATAGINTNQTMYLIRHAEAHPWSGWDDGNYVAAGQWRALAMPITLKGKLNPAPEMVYSIDPAQVIMGYSNFSYVRPSLTVEPYAIANNLPYYLVSEFELFDPASPAATLNYFFYNSKFSGKTILLAWEHSHFPPILDALLAKYPSPSTAKAPSWPSADYDTIWTVKLDANGNLTVHNGLCEGIDSASLPVTAPQF
jgi:hypothetical protein